MHGQVADERELRVRLPAGAVDVTVDCPFDVDSREVIDSGALLGAAEPVVVLRRSRVVNPFHDRLVTISHALPTRT